MTGLCIPPIIWVKPLRVLILAPESHQPLNRHGQNIRETEA